MSVSTQREGGTKGRGWTPGPWRAVRQENGDYRIIYNKTGNWIAEVYADGEMEAAETDARLIAAAPELFEFAAAHDAYMLDAGYSGPDDISLHPKAAANWRACRSALSRATATSEVER